MKDYYNEQILAVCKRKRMVLEAATFLKEEGLYHKSYWAYDKDVLTKLEAILDKLNSECWIDMPEITERDEFEDRIWDKREQQQEVKDWMESVEYGIRFDVLLATAKQLQKELESSMSCEVMELCHEWYCEEAQARYED